GSAFATQDMSAFPDTTSEWTGTPGGKLTDTNTPTVAYVAGDVPGYLLYGHDRTGGGVAGPPVNYVSIKTGKYWYTADADGTLHQWSAVSGTEFED
ncbi:MAG: hypothetical protein Q8O55_11465, partial [Dehalococcoidales bacterium]|nr:hypothetical protein [Dehalococcoidales bacterium]